MSDSDARSEANRTEVPDVKPKFTPVLRLLVEMDGEIDQDTWRELQTETYELRSKFMNALIHDRVETDREGRTKGEIS